MFSNSMTSEPNYSSLSSSSSSSSSNSNSSSPNRQPQRYHCQACNLLNNIWVCMICSYTGCGRYSSQHAQKHYDESRHPFSLELASGRIWNYDRDTFAHIESDSMLRQPAALLFSNEQPYREMDLQSSAAATSTPVTPSSTNNAAGELGSIDKNWARQRYSVERDPTQVPEVRDKLGTLLSQYEGP
jgi:hypothetical protein